LRTEPGPGDLPGQAQGFEIVWAVAGDAGGQDIAFPGRGGKLHTLELADHLYWYWGDVANYGNLRVPGFRGP
jgi:hypothetical protein